MFAYSLELIIFVSFISFLILLTLYYKKNKAKDFVDFSFGNGKISKFGLLGAVIGSFMSGNIFLISLQQAYWRGTIWIIGMFLSSLSYVFIAMFFVKNIITKTIHPYRDEGITDFSIYEWAGREYNSFWIRFCLCCCEFIGRLGIIIGNFRVIKFVIEGVLGYSLKASNLITIFLALFAITYVTIGGIRAASTMNIIAMIIFIIGILIVAYFSYKDIDPNIDYFPILKNDPRMNVDKYFQTFTGEIFVLGVWLKYFLPNVYGMHFQRIKMAKSNTHNMRSAFILGGIVDFLIKITIFFIVFNTFCFNQTLGENELLPYIATNFCPIEGLKSFFAVSLIAISLSSSISFLNSEAVLFTNDILPAFYKKKKNYTPNLKVAKIVTFFIGLITLLCSFFVEDIFSTLLNFALLYISIASMPMMCLLYNISAYKETVVIGMISGAVVTTICLIFTSGGLGCFFAGFLANAISYTITEFYLRNKKP